MSDSDSDSDSPSRLKQLAVRGRDYAELNEYEYFGETIELSMSPLEDKLLLPYSAVLEEKFGFDEIEDASEEIEDARDQEGDIDPSKVDEEFVIVMANICVDGVNTDEGYAEGATEAELREIFGIHNDEDRNIGLIGGLTLNIAQDIIDISSDAESAEKFRR
jgi:hypothetical protein